MDFEKRLDKAIERGQRMGSARAEEEAREAVNEEELKRLHSQYRLELSEHIERSVRKLADRFPGFRYETVVGDRGWGAAVRRDDAGAAPGSARENFFSRLVMTVRPFSEFHVLELTAKGAIRNKEIFNRTQYQRLTEVDLDSMSNLIDLWILEYAELFAAKA